MAPFSSCFITKTTVGRTTVFTGPIGQHAANHAQSEIISRCKARSSLSGQQKGERDERPACFSQKSQVIDLKMGTVLGGVVVSFNYSNNTRWFERVLLTLRRVFTHEPQSDSVPGVWGTDHLSHEQEGQADSV